jgi:hypothetical protein
VVAIKGSSAVTVATACSRLEAGRTCAGATDPAPSAAAATIKAKRRTMNILHLCGGPAAGAFKRSQKWLVD